MRARFNLPLLPAITLLATMLFTQVGNATLIFDNADEDRFSTRGAGNSPGTMLQVMTDTTINQMAVHNDLASDGEMRFVIFDHDSQTLLFDTGVTSFIDDGLSWKTSALFSFTLLAGVTYDIGAIANVAGRWVFDDVANSQNGISSFTSNPNFSDFDAPFLSGPGTADAHLRLFTANAISEPSLLGVMLLAMACLVRRRKMS